MKKYTLILFIFLSSCMKQSETGSSVPSAREQATSEMACKELVTETLRYNGRSEIEIIDSFIAKTNAFGKAEVSCLDRFLNINCVNDTCFINLKTKDELK